ncbi:MAG: bifunctional diaminohydroxyphosphoribosylaminopyrimidine deaminase/5-amino-6-(5-phosphoribosylamino)uracil reductase RibD [Methylococcales bacterium]|nr:bifunctional diaminohydroxyphosphoribosylaminopyrimidine deaminase/5-amino-6-(5-phosphoribosylamino)uracil reductase RibD [Methylococcales bacterium]
MKTDLIFMTKALQLAERGRFTTQPNPRVGCVLVKDGRIIGEGFHERAGQAHAEINALKKATEEVKGATAYVTLEPCSHHGRTPPCCDALIQAGIKRLVIAMMDPNPLVAGRGLARCKDAGIEVVCDILREDAEKLNRGFISRMTKNRPFVQSKIAMSLDGQTALANGESQWITSPQARADVHSFRAQSGAVLTGIGTVLADNPSLNARVPFDCVQPIRVVLDSTLQMPLNSKMTTLNGRTLILTCSKNEQKQDALKQVGFEVYVLPELNGRLDLNAVMTFLAGQEINNLFVEAGATLNAALLEAGLVDEWLIYMASCVLGDKSRGAFALPQFQSMTEKKSLRWSDIRQIGADLRLMLV